MLLRLIVAISLIAPSAQSAEELSFRQDVRLFINGVMVARATASVKKAAAEMQDPTVGLRSRDDLAGLSFGVPLLDEFKGARSMAAALMGVTPSPANGPKVLEAIKTFDVQMKTGVRAHADRDRLAWFYLSGLMVGSLKSAATQEELDSVLRALAQTVQRIPPSAPKQIVEPLKQIAAVTGAVALNSDAHKTLLRHVAAIDAYIKDAMVGRFGDR